MVIVLEGVIGGDSTSAIGSGQVRNVGGGVGEVGLRGDNVDGRDSEARWRRRRLSILVLSEPAGSVSEVREMCWQGRDSSEDE